uniref:Peptidase S1 domain-containing protein n=1 Tax=Gasterosteus aculeatus aculeatus TaxID=481459 RepID=G3NYA9_GASAC
MTSKEWIGLLTVASLLWAESHAQLGVCGIPPLNTRIVGGEDAPAGSWPWQVSLQKDGGHICGGSLINKEWVMSAAHCFSSVSTSGWQVSLGRQNLQGANPNEVSINVASIILHPQYNMGSRYNNDISLLRLSSPVQFTNYIRPVCLAASDSVFNNGTGSWVTGWGAVREGVSLPSPGTLQEVQVPVVGNRQCYCLNVKLGTVTDNMICAGVLAGGKDSCQGDSGGPMVNKKGSVWVQSGIVSFGEGCARPNLPGVYTRVSRYQSWIDSQISSDKPGFVQFTSNGLDADSSYTCPGLPPPVTPATTTTSTITPVCGRAPLNSRAVGDSGVVPGGTWPWMVRLHKNGLYACGGTLITRTVVLTSAQCFSSSNPNASEWTAFLGRSLVNVSGEFEISLGIVNITVSQLAGSNIGLLHLIEPVSYKDNIQPVCMDVAASRTFPIGSQCWVAGWEKSTAAVSSVLRDLETQVASCGNVSDSENICTVTINLQQEDQGGPLLCKSGSSWFQVAVVTISGTKSVRADVQVFAKASRFGSFLRATVGDIPSSAEDATGNSTAATMNSTAATGNSTAATGNSAAATGNSTAAPGNVTAATICGIPPLNTRIVGGEDAPAGSWPWQVSLQKDGRHICGGSLINKEWVMSAAHCFSSVSTSGWQVSLGRQNLQGANPNEVSINVASIILHPQYNMGGRFNNDISLLRLSSPVQFTNYIRPVCLAASDSVFNNGTGSWVTGWGAVREGVSLPSPGTLQEVQVPVVGNRQCYCLNVKLGTVTDNMICAGVLAGGKDSCQGDSGGPMVNKKGSVWVQSGIVSFGEGCARPNLPGVYTRVSRYQSWIDSQISSDKPGFVQFTSSGLDADSSYTCPGLPPPVTPATTTTSTITPVCGRAPLNSRAVGDSGVVPGGTWPWMVRLHKNGLYACGGTLITRTFVLTSAQCFSSSNPNASEWTAFLGRSLVNVSGEFEISLGIVNITVSQLAGSNIGLLHLIEPVSYKDNIQPVCMDVAASRTFPIGSQCWVAGWEKSTAAVSSVLRDLETQVASCGNVSDSENICTVTINLQQEDQGGPLLCKSGSSWFQVAVVTISGTKSVRADVQVFAKASRFGSFLRATVSDIPSPAEDATGNSAAATMNSTAATMNSTAATGNSAAATGNVTAATSNAESFSISLLLSFAVPMTSVFLLLGL